MQTFGEDVALGSSTSSFARGHQQQQQHQQQQRPQQHLTVSPPARDSSTIFSTSTSTATNTNSSNFFISPSNAFSSPSNAFSSPSQYKEFLDLLRSMPSPTAPWTTVLPTTPQLGQGYTLPTNLASPGAQGFTLPTSLPSPNAEATLQQLPPLDYNEDSALPPFPWFTSQMEDPTDQQQNQQEGQPVGSSSSLLSMEHFHDILEQVGNMASDNSNYQELFQSDFSPSPSPPTSTFDGSNTGRSPSPSRLNSAVSTRPCTPTSSMSSESCCSDNAGEDDQVVVSSGRQRTKRKTPDRALNEAEEIQSAPEKKP